MIENGTALTLDGFGVAFGANIVLDSIDLTVRSPSMSVIMGPAGAGKSTLLRTIAGLNDRQPNLRVWGHCQRRSAATGSIVFVRQNVRFLTSTMRETLCAALPHRAAMRLGDQTEHVAAVLKDYGVEDLMQHFDSDVLDLPAAKQRKLAVIRALIAEPEILLVDEIMTRLEPEDAADMVRILRTAAERRAVVCVTHNQRNAKALGGCVVLLAGGRVRATQDTEEFFTKPANELAKHFVRTGGLDLPSPNARPEELEPEFRAQAKPVSKVEEPKSPTPTGFRWLEPGLLGGCVRPGLLTEMDQDLEGLRALGIRVLVCLEETATIAAADLERFGLTGIHVPVDDMQAPSVDDAGVLCDRVRQLRDQKIPVAFHCRAGLGRTGTLLACTLIWDGASASEAFERTREIHPGWIQSEVQIEFLGEFAKSLRTGASAPDRNQGKVGRLCH